MDLPPTFVEGFHDETSVRKMEYRRLGRTDLMVSKLSIGGATFASFYGECDESKAIETIRNAIKCGINYIDTAPWYGQGRSEEIIGKALQGIPRQAYYLATKVGRYELELSKRFNFTAQKVIDEFNKSLAFLQLDYVDVIQIHDVEFADNLDIIILETLHTLKKFVEEGRARYIGVTGYPLDVLTDVIKRAPKSFDVVLSYSRYTLLDDSLRSYLPFFKDNDIGVVCASGLAMGLLTNVGEPLWHPASSEIKHLCRQAAEYCRFHNVELAQLALYYSTQLESVSTYLIGMQSNDLLMANLHTCLIGLSQEEQQVLDYIKRNFFKCSSNWEGVELEHYRTRCDKEDAPK